MTTPIALTIQSHVAWGHVGNSAAMLPLQLLGVEAVAVHTVQFSNHTGYGEFKGQVFPAQHIRDVLEGLQARGILEQCAAVLSGYLGDPATGEAILEAVATVRQLRPDARYICDPVMGDVGRGIFVRPGIPDFLRHRAVPATDIITPNQFEFELLVQTELQSLEHAIEQTRNLLRKPGLQPGPDTVIITSLRTPDLPADSVTTLAVTADAAWMVQTPHLQLAPMPSGMGDVFAATLLGHLLSGENLPVALGHTVSTLYGLIYHMPQGSRDLPLVAGRQHIIAPEQSFHARPV